MSETTPSTACTTVDINIILNKYSVQAVYEGCHEDYSFFTKDILVYHCGFCRHFMT